MKEMLVSLIALTVGAGSVALFVRLRLGSLRHLATQILTQAEADADAKSAQRALVQQEEELAQRRALDEHRTRAERRLAKEEERLKRQGEELDKRKRQLNERESALAKQEELKTQLETELSELAGMTRAEARAQMIARAEAETGRLREKRVREAEQEAATKAKSILATAVGRMATSVASSATVTTVSLPNDKLKGRIVGREGRNVRALEQLTGVTIVLDDTPGAVVISAFDPLRKEIARQALTDLVLDGRIHPSSIEAAVERAKERVDEELQERGRAAALQAGATLHPELERTLGRLHLRRSMGQNVLLHSLEVSSLMGIMAAELGLNEPLARRIGLLHDVGKALSHEMSGSHALLGRDLALKCGESEEVANGIGCHHDEIAPITLEGSLCSAADTLSAARPGARSEPLESSIQRMHKLEALAAARPGVLEVQALQAGRELRILVKPDLVDDEALFDLARSIAKEVEGTLSYPGKVRVAVERHRRVVQFAS